MRKPAKKCRTAGFVTTCSECGRGFVASAHVAPKCGGGFGDHSEHHEDDSEHGDEKAASGSAAGRSFLTSSQE